MEGHFSKVRKEQAKRRKLLRNMHEYRERLGLKTQTELMSHFWFCDNCNHGAVVEDFYESMIHELSRVTKKSKKAIRIRTRSIETSFMRCKNCGAIQ